MICLRGRVPKAREGGNEEAGCVYGNFFSKGKKSREEELSDLTMNIRAHAFVVTVQVLDKFDDTSTNILDIKSASPVRFSGTHKRYLRQCSSSKDISSITRAYQWIDVL